MKTGITGTEENDMNPHDDCVKRGNEQSTFDKVYFAIRYLQLDAAEVLCLVAEDAQGDVFGAWPQPERNLAELD
ncbi:MAG TPA: hypothetical protein VGR71_07570 [Nitrospira sp.]|nr:hypothetical protein [Nitrospira sp.]